MQGSVYRRCACRDDNGKMRGASCPRLGRERGHGTWYFHADTGRDPSTGKRREKRKGGFATKKDAEKALAEVLAEVGRGEHRHDDRQTLGPYLSTWLNEKISDGLRPSTALMYRRYIELDITPAIGHVRLGDLRPTHIEKLLRDLRAAGRGDTTRKRIHATIRSALTSARRSGLIRA